MIMNQYTLKIVILFSVIVITAVVSVLICRSSFLKQIENLNEEISAAETSISLAQKENSELMKTNEGLLKDKKDLQADYTVLEQENKEINAEKSAVSNELELILHPEGGVDEHGRLTAENGKIKDEKGNTVILRGISSHGIAWYPEYTNYAALKTFKEKGANVFRISMYVAQNEGYLEEPVLNRKLIYQAVENSRAADLYTIIDWHVLKDENPLNNLNRALNFFDTISAHYGDDPSIIYEICNEPNGGTTYENIYTYAEKVIPVIRKNAPNAMILVGTPEFCTQLSKVIKKPLPYKNIAYTYHFYAGLTNLASTKSEIKSALNNNLTVFVSEWGLESFEHGEKEWQETDEFLDFLDENGISWVNWALSNKNEGYSIIRSSVDKVGKLYDQDFSRIGKYVIDRLSEK